MQPSKLISNAQPTLALQEIIETKYVTGYYRLVSCVVRFNAKQRPYWKLKFVDSFGVITMYMFDQPTCFDSLYHGAFVKINATKKYFSDQPYFEVLSIQDIDYKQIENTICMASMPSIYCNQPDLLIACKRYWHK